MNCSLRPPLLAMTHSASSLGAPLRRECKLSLICKCTMEDTLVITAARVRNIVTHSLLIERLRGAYSEFSAFVIPPTTRHAIVPSASQEQAQAQLSASPSLLLFQAWGTAPQCPYLLVKSVTVFPHNGSKGLPAVAGTYVLSSLHTGKQLAVIASPAQAPNLQNKEGGINASHRERRPFKLEFPGSSKKTLFKSRKLGKSHVDTDAGSIFNPLSSHRFGSRVTRRVLVESHKSPSCFGQCLPAGRKAPVGLDPLNDSDEDKQFVTPPSTPGSSPQTRNSLVAVAGKQLQVPSGRFNMAAMLLSLCSESDESDEGNGITDDNGDEHLTTSRVPVSGSYTSGRIQQARPGTDDVTNMSNPRCIVADVNSESAPPDREIRLRQTEGSPQSNFAWKSRDQIGARLDPFAAFVTTKVQEHGKSESANERPENAAGKEEIRPRGSCSSLARKFSARSSNCSSSSPKFVWSGSIDKTTVLPAPAAHNRAESLSMPRYSCGSSDYSFIASCSSFSREWHAPQRWQLITSPGRTPK